MKKVTLFLFIFGCFLSLSAQHVFNPIAGPINVPSGTPPTVTVNDSGNSSSAPASSTGTYNAFSISVDWVNGFDAWSSEADLTITTSAGSVTIDPPSTGALTGGGNTTLTFDGEFSGFYDPTTDGLLELTLNQSFGGSNADWSNIVVTIFETPTCPEPSNLNVTGITPDSADVDWNAGNAENTWLLEWNGGADFTPGNGEEEGAATINGTPSGTLSGLTPSTQYFLYYLAECGPGDNSLWVGPITFTTLNVPPPAPVGVTCSSGDASFVYTAEFDAFDGWTGDLTTTDQSGFWEIPGASGSLDTGPDAAFSGANYMNYEASGGATATASAVSPAIDLSSAVDGAELSFYMHAFGEDMGTLNVGIGISATGPFTPEFTWVGELQTSNAADWVPVGINLDAYLGQTIYVEFSHTGTGDFNGDMSIDLMRVETCGSFCIAPSSIVADNLTANSADISWAANNGETSWEYVVQPAGTGEPTSGNSVSTTSVTETGLMPSTDYEIYVLAICASGNSLWAGPINFTTPIQTDFVLDCASGGPVTQDYCYENGGATNPVIFTFSSNDGTSLNLTFNSGNVENTWDELVVLDSDGTPFPGFAPADNNYGNAGDISGISLQSTGDTISFYINSDGSVSCGSGSTALAGGINYTVNCATCTNPVADYAVVSDCINGPQFLVDVDLTDLGSASSVIISDNLDPANDQTVSATGVYTFGPYPNNTDVVISVANATDSNCIVSSPSLTQDICTETFLDCANGGPVTLDYCYDNGGAANPEILTFTSLDGTPLNLTFNSGFVENNWDELVVLDSDDTPFPGFAPTDDNYGNNGNIGGLTFQSSGDTISFYINSDGSVSCASSGAPLSDGINYTVACATCINPQATYAVIDDCANGDQFLIDVNVDDLGDATSLTISNNINGDTIDNITATGTYQVGPFPFLVDVIITISNDQDGNCVINSQPIQLLACPPVNDNPCSAAIAVVNADESCTTSTPGTILAATPSGVPPGSCAGDPDDDVWFEFVALGEQQIIQIENIAGGTFNLDHALYEGTCDNLTEIYCSPDDFSLTPGLTIGNTYYVRVFSAGSVDETSTFDLCISTLGEPTFCLDALPICADPNIDYPSVVGDQVAPPYLDYDCLGSQPDPQWNTILFDDPGDYQFSLDQVSDTGTPLDIDFIVWGPFVDQQTGCVELITPNIVDCSFSPTASETINLNNVPANSTYVILITNFSQQPGTYTFTQDSGPVDGTNCDVVCDVVLEIEGAPIDDDEPDLGTPDEILNYCGFDSVTLEATTFYDVDQYVWYQDGFVIPGATDPTYVASESGTYQVQVLGGICDQSEVYFSALAELNFYDDPGNVDSFAEEVCDGPEADGVEDFDLDAISASLGFGPEFTISYYTNLSDANQAINPVGSPYNTSGETLIIRVEDSDAANDGFLGCREISEVELVVLATPALGVPIDLETCSANTTAEFMLTDNDTVILNGANPTEVTLTYHNTLADADTGTGALTSPYTGSNGEVIYVRLENNTTGCYNTTSFSLIINAPSHTALSQDIEECDDNDGTLDDIADFDLDAHTVIVLDGQDPSNYNVTYHSSQEDAENNVDALPGLYSSGSTTIYVRVEDVLLPNCYVVNFFNLVVLDEVTATINTDVFYFDTETNEFLLCPEADSGVVLTILPNDFTASEVTIEWLIDNATIPGETDLSIEVFEEGDYSAIITLNTTGCSFTLTAPTVVEFENCVIPQGISPGVSIGQNDTFDLRYFNVKTLQIFNRNGTLVYSKDNYRDEWVGQTDDGEELPVGTYFYTMIYEGGTKTRTGWIYINR